jgi:hypothetical protein
MSDYHCEICNKSFACKQNLDNHLNKKNKCKLNPLQCEYCGKNFTRKDNLNRHLNSSCKEQPQIQNNINNSYNTTNNNITNNNHNNITNNYINIVKFRGETEQQISDMIDAAFISRINKALINPDNKLHLMGNLLKEINFNKEHPEFHNVYAVNERTKRVYYFNGEYWTQENILEDVYDRCLEYVEIFENKYKEITSDTSKQKYKCINAALHWFGNDIADDEEFNKSNENDIFHILYYLRDIPVITRRRLNSQMSMDNFV